VPREDGELLYRLAKRRPGGTTLETGMGFGVSSMFMCLAHQENGGGKHYAIDPFERDHWEGIGELTVERAGLSAYLEFVPDYSYRALPRLLDQGVELDFAFLDGDHRFEGVFADWLYVDQMLKPGGLLMFHDIGMPATQKFLTFLLEHHVDRYARFEEIVPAPRGRVAALWYFVKHLAIDPWEPRVARALARKRFPKDYVVLRKDRSMTTDDAFKGWDFYRPF